MWKTYWMCLEYDLIIMIYQTTFRQLHQHKFFFLTHVLAEAENSVHTSSEFYGLTGNFGLCTCDPMLLGILRLHS